MFNFFHILVKFISRQVYYSQSFWYQDSFLLKVYSILQSASATCWAPLFFTTLVFPTYCLNRKRYRCGWFLINTIFLLNDSITLHGILTMRRIEYRPLTKKLTYGFGKNSTIVTQIGTKRYNCYTNSDKMVQLLHSHVNFSGRPL